MANWQVFDDTWNQGSFPSIVPAPNADPGAAPTVCVQFGAPWLPWVLGSLFQLTQPSTWDPASPGYADAVGQAQSLMAIFSAAGVCTDMLQFQFTSGCGLQYSIDGGVTWIDVPGWSTFAPTCFTGPTGATGATGAAGVTPQLRWNGCTFQVSTDGGATWSNLSGFDITTLQGCLAGTPGNPQGVSSAQQACNIAAWLAADVLQASMAQAATELSGGSSLLNAALAILGVASLLTGVGEIAIAAAAAFFFSAGGIGSTQLNAAAADATLKSELTCAIYSAISADGYVTSANFSTAAANINAISYGTPAIIGLLYNYWNSLGYVGINAIQGEGALYMGDCTACGAPAPPSSTWAPTAVYVPYVSVVGETVTSTYAGNIYVSGSSVALAPSNTGLSPAGQGIIGTVTTLTDSSARLFLSDNNTSISGWEVAIVSGQYQVRDIPGGTVHYHATTAALGDVVTLLWDGVNIQVDVNGTNIFTFATAWPPATQMFPGLYFSSAGVSWDNVALVLAV